MTNQIDTIVIGAGVIGLAVARAFALSGRSVIVLETAQTIGTQTSARNSEVIHAGLYYPTGSLKAQLCISGRRRLYDFCEKNGIPHMRCGKLIVAQAGQEAALSALHKQALANGVDDVELLSAQEAVSMEPDLKCTAALHSPSTGIIDSHAYMLALWGEAESHGAQIVFHAAVERITAKQNGMHVLIGGIHDTQIMASQVINCAGLDAHLMAGQIEGYEATYIPQVYYAKGNYFSLSGKAPFSHLVYPLPQNGGLGVHFTRDMAGRGRFGPDVQWVDKIDYAVDQNRGESFYEVVRRYWPNLKDGALNADYSGIRPKLSEPGEAAADFMIQGPEIHGVPGLVHLYGIESPGLTASLSIADAVYERLASG